jgi:hypothetical protein
MRILTIPVLLTQEIRRSEGQEKTKQKQKQDKQKNKKISYSPILLISCLNVSLPHSTHFDVGIDSPWSKAA